MVEPDRLQMTMWRLLFTCWITKATNTDTVYVINIALPRQNVCANVTRYYIMRTLPVLFENELLDTIF
jgi:hypothetical protein